ncbi:MAG: MoaD/ThiS family protein [Nocardioides sp.]|jgi:molybdopterin synthase sulfur carrier subunit
MTPATAQDSDHETGGPVVVRLWAAARAAAGAGEILVDLAEPTTLAAVTDHLAQSYGERLAAVLAVCSVLVDEHPASAQDPAEVSVLPGQTLDFLPPFAGG